MPRPPACLVDTNILLRLSRLADPQFHSIQTSLANLERQNTELFYSLQNIAEFWNVSTRPLNRNGFGLTIEQTNQNLEAFEGGMTLLPDNDDVYRLWRSLVLTHRISGVQVHDARLAALMQVHGVDAILTLNAPDFRRFTHLRVLTPTQ